MPWSEEKFLLFCEDVVFNFNLRQHFSVKTFDGPLKKELSFFCGFPKALGQTASRVLTATKRA